MNNNTMTVRDRTTNLRSMLGKMEGQIALALPKHLTPERLIRVVMTAVQRNPELLECEPRSIMAGVMQCSELGLEPASVLQQIHLIPFKNRKTGNREAQVIIGYKGLLELAYRSGQVQSISAEIVYEKDTLDYRKGDKPQIFHKPFRGADAGPMIAAYAVVNLKDGGIARHLMWKPQIDKVRAGKQYGPWNDHYEEMAKKTVIRRACKYLSLSIEDKRQETFAKAVALDELGEAGVSQGLTVEMGLAEQSKPAASLDDVAAALPPAPAQADADGEIPTDFDLIP